MNLAYAYDLPLPTGCLKSTPEDFQVFEDLGYSLSGDGEHYYLYIEKRDLTTQELLLQLSRILKKPLNVFSTAGIKDKFAVTCQWVGVHCPGENLEGIGQLEGSHFRVLHHTKHLKKLKTGHLAGNQFKIVLREISDMTAAKARLEKIKQTGVPNYFGEQRFGSNGHNLTKAAQVLFEQRKVKNRFLKGMYYSAARSYLFNQILHFRILNQTWNKALPGDVMQLSGTHSHFVVEAPDDIIQARIAEHDISPAVPLWGRGAERSAGEALSVLQAALAEHQQWCSALEAHGLQKAYRPLKLSVPDLTWECDEKDLFLTFSLPSGAYATSVIREIINSHHEMNVDDEDSL